MPKRTAGAGVAIATSIHDSLCRRIRIAEERIRLARELEIVLRKLPDVLVVAPKGLEDLSAYRRLADYGLVQASVRSVGGTIIVLAASNRIWRRRDLKRRLVAIKREAHRIGRRVVLVTRRGLVRAGGDRPYRGSHASACVPTSFDAASPA